jgi:hypothetical protein
MKASQLIETIKGTIGEAYEKIIGPRVHPNDPSSIASLCKELGDKEFFEVLKKAIDAAVDYSAPSGFKLTKHKMDNDSFDFEYESEDDEYGPEALSFSFNKKKGYLEVGYGGSEVIGYTPATHLDPPEYNTREINNEVQIFSAHNLKNIIDDALDEVIERPDYSYTAQDAAADQGDRRYHQMVDEPERFGRRW